MTISRAIDELLSSVTAYRGKGCGTDYVPWQLVGSPCLARPQEPLRRCCQLVTTLAALHLRPRGAVRPALPSLGPREKTNLEAWAVAGVGVEREGLEAAPAVA